MTPYAGDLWGRACEALVAARVVVDASPDAAASRAYYAAFYGVSAHFAIADQTFTKHSAVEAAVHRDMVKRGAISAELGQAYSRLVEIRSTGDYGLGQHVSKAAAGDAIEMAGAILEAVWQLHPDVFAEVPQ